MSIPIATISIRLCIWAVIFNWKEKNTQKDKWEILGKDKHGLSKYHTVFFILGDLQRISYEYYWFFTF